MNTKIILSAFALLFSLACRAQNVKSPSISPYELNAKGKAVLPANAENGIVQITSDKQELGFLPKIYPYRTVAYFDSARLISLHAVFGETGDGLSFQGYEFIKNILLKLWDYPTVSVNGRRGIGKITQVWETRDFRMEWTYQNQPGSTTKKMGWLFIYNRHHFIEAYSSVKKD